MLMFQIPWSLYAKTVRDILLDMGEDTKQRQNAQLQCCLVFKLIFAIVLWGERCVNVF